MTELYLDAQGILIMQSVYGYKFKSISKYSSKWGELSDGIYFCEIYRPNGLIQEKKELEKWLYSKLNEYTNGNLILIVALLSSG